MPSDRARRQEDTAGQGSARKVLAQSPRYFQALFDNALDAILLADDQGHYVDANPAACALTGYNRQELLKMEVWDITPAPDRDSAPELWRQFLSMGRLSGEYTIECKDGTEREIEFRSVANIVPGIHFTVNRDITERKQMEAALRETKERFSKAFHGNPIPIGITTVAEGRFIDVNDSLLRLYGYHRDEVIGRTSVELKMARNPSDRDGLVQRLRKQGILHNVEHTFWTKSGELRQGDTSLELITLKGEPCILALTLDITERKRTEEALQKERDFIAAVIDTVDCLVVVLDRQGHIIRFNRACEQLSGYSFDEVKGSSYIDLLLMPEERKVVKAVFEDICSGQFPNTYKNHWLTRDGSRRLIAWSNTALLNIEGAVKYVIGTGVDITEQQQSEESLRQSREQLRALAARQESALEAERSHISREIHDQLGQAFSALKMDLWWLNDRLPTAPEEELHHKMTAMSQLIDTSIRTVRDIATDLRPAMLDDLGLEPAIEAHAQRFEERTGISCAFTSRGDDLALTGQQATVVFRILQEALTNVARHAGATHVDVRLQQQAGNLLVEITDDGRGITPAEITNLRSLGLLGMRERAHLIGGVIEFESHAMRSQGGSQGTTVTIRIPLHTQGVQAGGSRQP
jgi:PAS domain S-box-containing protein